MKKTKLCTNGHYSDISNFHKNKSTKDGLAKYCKTCSAENNRKSYYKTDRKTKLLERNRLLVDTNRRWVFDYLLEHPCVDCGENNPVLLEFDHINPNKKIKAIAEMVNQKYSLNTIIKEIKKCNVRCVTCHRIKTARENNYYTHVMYHKLLQGIF